MLVGQTITLLTGEEATITDFSAAGATVQVRETAQIRFIPMHEIHLTTRLWWQLGRAPDADDLRQAGIEEDYIPYLVPLLNVIRQTPDDRRRGRDRPEA